MVVLISSLIAGLANAVPNTKIAFTSNGAGQNDIWIMDAGGGNAVNLTADFPTVASDPSWSPDGMRVAFVVGPNVDNDIYTMDADGTNLVNLTPVSNRGNAEPAWSPDGTRIAFTSDRDTSSGAPNADIYLVDADGGNLVRLTFHAADDSYAAWSPDGTRIAFYSNRDGDYDIYTMDAIDGEGSGLFNVTSNTSANDYQPAWSPDGTQIAFHSDRDGAPQIYVINADGTDQTRRTGLLGTNVSPSWSPDGSKLAFTSDRDGDREIYVVDADGTGVVNVTNSASSIETLADWSPFLPVPVLTVAIGIKPGSDGNPINLKSEGLIPVAILASGDWDGAAVDGVSVRFGPGEAAPAHGEGHLEDVNDDGLVDWVAHFRTQEVGLPLDATDASNTGQTVHGQEIAGIDFVRIIGGKKGKGAPALDPASQRIADWGTLKLEKEQSATG